MQNLTECARRHYTVSKKLIKPVLRCCTGKRSDSSKTFASSTCKFWTDRLFSPGPQRVSKDLQVISSFLTNSNFISPHCTFSVPGLHSVRYFHTTGASGYPRQVKKDDEKKPEQNEESDKDKKSDKEESDKNNKTQQEAVPVLIHMLILLGTFMTVTLFIRSLSSADGQDMIVKVSWNEFVHHMLAKGEVSKIVINNDSNIIRIVLQDDAIVFNKKHVFKNVYMVVPDVEKTEEKIRQAEDALGIPYTQRVPIVYERVPERTKFLIHVILASLIIMLVASMSSKAGNIVKELQKMHPGLAKFTLVEPTTGKGIKFSDVAGLQEAKVEVMEFVDYLKNPERYRTLGAKIPKGALLLGPPGCGKTMLAKAVATESNVPFLSMNGCEFIEMFGGLGAARVRDLFKEAKNRAPSIIYIDEIDAFGQARATNSQSSNNESERTLVQLLVEMDGMASKDDIIILASTNRANVLDKALLRRGRFDRHILIDLPTQTERKQIFEKHLASLSLQKPPSEYSDYLASLTPGFTGADIANVCNESALHAARLGKKKIFGNDLMYAIERARSGPSKSTNAMSPMETRIVAYREAGFALLTWMLKHTDPVAKITIVPTTSGSLGHTQILEALSYTIPMNKIEDITCATIGSRVAENLVFGYATDATKHHLKKVTDLVTKQVAQFGMSPVVGLLSFEPDRFQTEGRPFSKKLSSIIDVEVRRIIMEASNRAEEMLVKHRRLLNALAEELLKRETLYYEDIERLIGAPPYSKKRPQVPPSFMVGEEDNAESGR